MRHLLASLYFLSHYHPKGFLDVLDGQWWTIDRKLTAEQIKYSAMDTMISCIRNGVTTIFDHHASFGQIKGSLFTIAAAAKELGRHDGDARSVYPFR